MKIEAEPETSESFAWRVRLLDSEPQKAGVVAFSAFGAAAVGLFVFRSPLLAVLGFAIILGSTAEFWLGTSFVIDSKGARSRTGFSLTAIEWENVRRIVPEGNGIRLSPLEQPGNLDAFRGVLLRFDPSQREAVEEAISRFGRLRGNSLDAPDG